MTEGTLQAEKGPPKKAADLWPEIVSVSCEISVDLPVTSLTVGALYRLTVNSIVETSHPDGANVPVKLNGQLIAWGEFYVVGDQLAVRISELA